MTLQTKEPMTPNDFLHGVLTPEDEQRMVPEDVRIARNYTRFVTGFGGGG